MIGEMIGEKMGELMGEMMGVGELMKGKIHGDGPRLHILP